MNECTRSPMCSACRARQERDEQRHLEVIERRGFLSVGRDPYPVTTGDLGAGLLASLQGNRSLKGPGPGED